MEIFYDNEIFIMQKYGGISRYFYEIIKRLSGFKNYFADVYKGININMYPIEDYAGSNVKISGSKIKFIPGTKFIIGKIQEPLFYIKYQNTDFDIFHSTYYRKIMKKQGSKRVTTVHDFTHEKYPGYFSKLDKTSSNKKYAIENSDGIICISQTTRNDLLNYFRIDENKIKVIYHGNSLDEEPGTKPLYEFPYICFVGSRKGYKNFDKFIYAYSKSETLKKNLNIVCFGGGGFSGKEIKYFEELKIRSKMFQISGKDKLLANIYKFAFMFVYPSLYEGFGIPILEAMHYGCPVLASNGSSLSEIGGNAAEYFEPDNYEEILNKMELVFENRQIRELLIEKGNVRKKDFSWDKCSEETYNFYKEVYNG